MAEKNEIVLLLLLLLHTFSTRVYLLINLQVFGDYARIIKIICKNYRKKKKERKEEGHNVIPYNFSIEEKLYRKFAVCAKQLSRLVE